jgi:hypothetical protein
MGHFAPGTLNFLGGTIDDVIPINFKLAITNRGLNTIYEMVTFNALQVNPAPNKKQVALLAVLFVVAAGAFIILLWIALATSLRRKNTVGPVMAPAELNRTLENWENTRGSSILNKVESEMKSVPGSRVSMTETVTMEPPERFSRLQPMELRQPVQYVQPRKEPERQALVQAIKQISNSQEAFVNLPSVLASEVKQVEGAVADNLKSIIQTGRESFPEKLRLGKEIMAETNTLLNSAAAKQVELAKISNNTATLEASEKIKLSEISEAQLKTQEIQNIALEAMKTIAGIK